MDLTTSYLGLPLKHPLVASAGPLSASIGGVRRLEDAGASAVVLCSLFEEQIRHEETSLHQLLGQGTESFGEALSFFPAVTEYRVGPHEYLELVRRSAAACEIPIIGSLNGTTETGWTDYARLIEEAGASAVELNVFFIPADLRMGGGEVEERYLRIVGAVRSAVSIPVAIKLNPFFSSMGDMAKRLVHAGADGLVLFNRFYQPDFDLDALEVDTRLALSSPEEIRLPLLWIAVLYGRLSASLAATSGVESAAEVVKFLLAGADAVMTTSALLRHGPEHLGSLLSGLEAWMAAKGYDSVTRMRGAMSQRNVANPSAFERANYLQMIAGYRA